MAQHARHFRGEIVCRFGDHGAADIGTGKSAAAPDRHFPAEFQGGHHAVFQAPDQRVVVLDAQQPGGAQGQPSGGGHAQGFDQVVG
jgi:hypothetical protein